MKENNNELYNHKKFKEQLGNMEIAQWDITIHNTYFIRNDGVAFSVSHNDRNIRVLKTVNSGKGYKAHSINGKTITVHKMVAKTFIPNPYDKKQVNHIDGNKDNNNVKNLEWVSQSENMQHAYDTGLRKQRKLKNSDVIEIREKYATGNYTHRQLGEEYNVNHSTIGNVLRSKTYNFLY